MAFNIFRTLTSTSLRCKYLLQRNISVSRIVLQGQNNPGSHTYKPNNLEKKFLVWTGKYKTLEEVPAYVSNEAMERSRNKVRIRLANIMMALTVVGCILMVISGKRAAERGETVTKENLDWHKKYNEQTAAAAGNK